MKKNPHHQLDMSRREALARCGMGMGGLALATVMEAAGQLGPAARAATRESLNPLLPRQPHFAGKAKHIIHIFANGGASHVDTFDPKPELMRWAGKPVPGHLPTERQTIAAFPSPFSFKKYGKSGIEVSELFSNV